MKIDFTASYRNRLLLLGALALLFCGLLVKTKVAPAFKQWSTHRTLASKSGSMQELAQEKNRLMERTAALEKRMGTASAEGAGWYAALDLLENGKTGMDVALSGIAEEHIAEQFGLQVHTLPMTLEGNTADLVNTIDTIERIGNGVFLISLDMQAKQPTYNAPRKLTATLYLQTISQ